MNVQTRSYGPSNWEERPQETRTGIAKAPVPGKHVGEEAREIWGAHDLMREQVSAALGADETGPDAMLGLKWELADTKYGMGRDAASLDEINDLLHQREALIHNAIALFKRVPDEYIAKYGHSRMQGAAGEFGENLLKRLERNSFKVDKGDHYTLQQLTSILDVVAVYFDAKERGTLN